MNAYLNKIVTSGLIIVLCISCDDFLTKTPLETPSTETFWQTPDQAELWVNNLYNGLGGVEESIYEAYSDNAYGRAGNGANNIASGSYEPNDTRVDSEWNYRYIRLSLEFFENVERVPDFPQEKLDELSGQVHFMLAYQYYKLTTFFRDVPLVTTVLDVSNSDVEKSPKADVLNYIYEQLDMAIATLPETYPDSETGRITKGAALALLARVHLYNEEWQEAADAAKQIMDLGIYELHPNFEELFLWDFNNQTKEVILANQYAETVHVNDIVRRYAPYTLIGYALILPTAQLAESFEMSDGLPIDESPLYDPTDPFANRDPRFYKTLLWHGQELNGQILDETGAENKFAVTYLYYRKYIGDLKDKLWESHVNWILFRYAEVLLTYAEATNEATGPDESVYDALDAIRTRAGMPLVDRSKYADQSSLRELIRNERRVELAGEGLRYFDIIRWKIAEDVLNIDLKSMDLSNWVDGPKDENGNPILVQRPVETRIFDPSKNYVWPIPQDAIDQSDVLTQHPEWK